MNNIDAQMKVELVSFAAINRLTRKLAHKIQDSGFKAEIIICIARGGYVPARLLCDLLNIYDLASIRIRHYTGSEKTEKAVLLEPLAASISGKNVLLVDDIDDSGETLEVARNYLNELRPGDVRVAVLHHKTVSTIKPDFYAQKIVQWRWVTYPWAIVEDVLGFVKNMQPRPVSVEAATERLAQDYKLKVTSQVMEDVFRLL